MFAVVTSRRWAARASAVTGLLIGTVVAAPGHPAYAEGGTFSLTIICGSNGAPTGSVMVKEAFTGLQTTSPYPGYQASATITASSGQATAGDSNYWYPDSDGTHTDNFADSPYSSDPNYSVHGGQGYQWQLDRIYGQRTTVLSGSGAIGGTCTPKPAPATYANSPDSIRVHSDRTFTFPFKAHAGLKAHVKVSHDGNVIAATDLTVPSSGVGKAHLTLTQTAFHHLKAVGHETARVTVTLKNAGGTTSSHTSVVLKKPLT